MGTPDQKSFKQLTISVEKLPALTGRQETTNQYAADRARLLLGCYRTGDANDPETYVAAIAAVLSRFSQEVITVVTHPATGLPSRSTWLPTVKEVRDACDEIQDRNFQIAERERRIQRQFAEREEYERAREYVPTYEELKAKYGENWGLIAADERQKSTFKAPSVDDLRSHYSEFGLQFKRKETAA